MGAARVVFRDLPVAYPETEIPCDAQGAPSVKRRAASPGAMSTPSFPSRTAVSPSPRPAPTRSLPPSAGRGRAPVRAGGPSTATGA